MSLFFIYGAPGSGKTTIGKILGERLDMPFVDLDGVIAAEARMAIPDIFAAEGEAGFRARERKALLEVIDRGDAVVAPGGGALLDPGNRAAAEAAGRVLFLEADLATLEGRVKKAPGSRPLLSDCAAPPRPGQSKPLSQLLAERATHYATFPCRVRVSDAEPEKTADLAQAALGLYRIKGMGADYDVRVERGLLEHFGTAFLAAGGSARTVVVCDSVTRQLFGDRVLASLQKAGVKADLFSIPAGEASKTVATVGSIWAAFLRGGLERGDVAVALGGGVVGDLTGFAAATWLRGIRWVVAPTTLLAMVDSSLGGKTGADLPEGKNLVGAFHPPIAVLSDPAALAVLPIRELRCGLAESIKHAVIADPALRELISGFAFCRGADPAEPAMNLASAAWLPMFVSRALAVKANVICQDPFEKGARAALNLGHTVGHGLEKASWFAIRHGEAVAIGTVAAARLSEWMGLAEDGLAEEVAGAFASVGLPTEIPRNIDWAAAKAAIRLDKKRKNGEVRFVLPVAWGKVTFETVPDALLDRLEDTK